MADPTLDYEQQLPSLLRNLNTALTTQTSGNQSALSDYQQYLQNRQNQVGEVNLPLMAFAAGLGSPTRTGSIGESLSLGLKSTMPYIESGRQASDQRMQEMMRISMAKNSLATELAQKQLENAKIPLTAQGDMASALAQKADLDYIRRGQNVPGIPGAKPGANVPGAIRGSQAEPQGPDFNTPPPTAAAAPPPAPVNPPAAARPAPPPQGDNIVGGESQAQVLGGNLSPPADFTVVAQAQGLPTPRPPAQPAPPGPVALGNGTMGYRPPAAVANQLDAAYTIATQNRAQNRGSARAGADADAAQKYLDKFMEKGFVWDPNSRTLVPVGPADPAYNRSLEYNKGLGTQRAKAENEMTAVPSGPDGMGPNVLKRNSELLDNAEGNEYLRQIGKPAEGETISAPSPMQAKRVEGVIKSEEQMQEAQAVLPQTKVQLDAVKQLLTKFETGKWAENKGEIIAGLRSAGFDIPDPPPGADPAAVQQMIKGSIDQVFKRVEEIGGRVLASEIIGLQKAVFDPNLQPAANRELVASLAAANSYTQKYIDDYQKWRSENPYETNTLKFKNEWVKANPFQNYKNTEITNTVVKGAPPIPAKYYSAPDPASLQPGQRWNHPQYGVVEYDPSDPKNPIKVIGRQ